jgi:hypothetical protein
MMIPLAEQMLINIFISIIWTREQDDWNNVSYHINYVLFRVHSSNQQAFEIPSG